MNYFIVDKYYLHQTIDNIRTVSCCKIVKYSLILIALISIEYNVRLNQIIGVFELDDIIYQTSLRLITRMIMQKS